jgi:hypothetical protein
MVPKCTSAMSNPLETIATSTLCVARTLLSTV